MKMPSRLPLALLFLLTASSAANLRAAPDAPPSPDGQIETLATPDPLLVQTTPESLPPKVGEFFKEALRRNPPSPNDPLVGKWAWHDYVTITFNADGTGLVSDGNPVTWKTAPSQPGTHAYVVRWPQRGFREEVTIHDGAQIALLIGDSQTNYTARRIADPIVGKWDWHHHQTVTFQADGTCESTDGMHGTWRLAAGNNPARRYVIVFENGQFTDELTFNPDGRTALLVGSYRENYTVSRAGE